MEDARRYYADYHAAMGEEWDFALKLIRFFDDEGQTRDRRRIQFKGRELTSKIRHKSAEITKDFYFECRPMNAGRDKAQAQDAKRLLEWETTLQPQKFFSEMTESVVICALAGRIGVGAVDYEPACRPSGELLYRVRDPRNFFWTPGWRNPHELDCPWVGETRYLTLDWIKTRKDYGWKNVDDVRADMGRPSVGSADNAPGPTGSVNVGGSQGLGAGSTATPRATIAYWWYRNDYTTKTRTSDEVVDLAPTDRYLACPSCGYQDRSGNGPDLPEINGPCPKCWEKEQVNLLQRVDRERPTEAVLAYPDLRLVICAPYSGVLLYDGPGPKLRSVPYLFFGCYNHPLEPIGMSDTAYDWNAQLISDSSVRMGYEQMSASRRVIGMVDGGTRDSQFTNAEGSPFTLSDADGSIMYAPDVAMLQGGIREIQGAGLPAAWGQWIGRVQEMLRQDLGTTDLDLNAQQTRNIPVGTVEALVEQAEIPVAKHRERLNDAMSIFLGVVLDYAIATGADERVVGYIADDGTYDLKPLRYSSVPAAHVICTASPRAAMMSNEEVKAAMQWFQAPPPLRKFLARKMNISPTDLQQIEADEQAWQQQQQQQQQAAAASPGGTGMMPSGAPGMAPPPAPMSSMGAPAMAGPQ